LCLGLVFQTLSISNSLSIASFNHLTYSVVISLYMLSIAFHICRDVLALSNWDEAIIFLKATFEISHIKSLFQCKSYSCFFSRFFTFWSLPYLVFRAISSSLIHLTYLYTCLIISFFIFLILIFCFYIFFQP
jgi:hypothetical protein